MTKSKKSQKLAEERIEKGLEFIESFQRMLANKDEKTVAISLRIPANVLRALKFRAEQNDQKYQSLLVEYLRRGLKSDYKYE